MTLGFFQTLPVWRSYYPVNYCTLQFSKLNIFLRQSEDNIFIKFWSPLLRTQTLCPVYYRYESNVPWMWLSYRLIFISISQFSPSPQNSHMSQWWKEMLGAHLRSSSYHASLWWLRHSYQVRFVCWFFLFRLYALRKQSFQHTNSGSCPQWAQACPSINLEWTSVGIIIEHTILI